VISVATQFKKITPYIGCAFLLSACASNVPLDKNSKKKTFQTKKTKVRLAKSQKQISIEWLM